MPSLCRGFYWSCVLLVGWFANGHFAGSPTLGAEVVLKDGRVIPGKMGMVSGLAEMPMGSDPEGTGPAQLILLLDDDLRRIFLPKSSLLIQEVRRDTVSAPDEKFTIPQQILRSGRQVRSVGPVLGIKPFDEFGRRIFTFGTVQGPVNIIQGITQITPKWTKVEGISHLWDMRIATSTIPPDILHKILMKQINPKDVEHHRKIARFYLQSERYAEARQVLEDMVKAFPEMSNLRQQMAPMIQTIRDMGAQKLLGELKLRRAAGQHVLVVDKLKAFPAEDVQGAVLQEVREILEEYKTLEDRRTEVLKQLDELVEKIDDTPLKERIRPIAREIHEELNLTTLGRMASFRQHQGDADLKPAEIVSFAISGWLVGSDAAVEKLPLSLSMFKVRGLVREYLNEPMKINRARILEYLRSEEAASPSLVAALVANMKPAAGPAKASDTQPGYHELEIVTMPKEPPVRYLVQLPPEYDPYRRYPTIVTLRGAGTSAALQIDWWAGTWAKGGWRAGQASRYGYIVVAPEWTTEHQKQYDYSAREHAAVLGTLRDACRRFSIDTDRVFLSGHSMGGDAAWDIGLAHPDLWAGVIPIVATSDRYCTLYWKNAKRLPFYVVGGELDGNKLAHNARDLDRYLKGAFNTTVVEYQGRGHESFSDEILRLYDWMGRCQRDFFPREFTCSTMRPWDNYFWWLEVSGLPTRSMVDPDNWPPKRGTQAVQLSGEILKNNGLNLRAPTGQVTVWLSPKMVDFEQKVSITVNGRQVNGRNPSIQPDLETLLEDVRTRGDRQHPFWAKYEAPTGRLPAEP